MPYVAASVLQARHVRVGLEDNCGLERRARHERKALVSRAVSTSKNMGATIHGPRLPLRQKTWPDKAGTTMTKTAAIIGGGVIGRRWAARFALSGWDVAIFDPDPEAGSKISEVHGERGRRFLAGLIRGRVAAEGQVNRPNNCQKPLQGRTGSRKRAGNALG